MSELSIVARAINALSSFGVTTEREAGQLLPMWLHYREMTVDDRNAVYQHYRTELAKVRADLLAMLRDAAEHRHAMHHIAALAEIRALTRVGMSDEEFRTKTIEILDAVLQVDQEIDEASEAVTR